MDISIVIAHRGDPMGLWSSIHSCIEELKHTDYSYEFCICVNGEAERIKSEKHKAGTILCPDTHAVLHFLSKSNLLGYLKIIQSSVSPPTARQYASEKASGKYLFFFDNHVLVARNYFSEAINTLENEADLVHSKTTFFTGEDDTYEYELLLNTTFWATASLKPKQETAYPIAVAGHGGFAVKTTVWRDVGGYPDVFRGYAGEELTLDLKLWMQGYQVWINPQMVHYHWAGKRAYARHFTADYYRNLLMSANIVGGYKYLMRVYLHIIKNFPELTSTSFFNILTEAYYASDGYRIELHKRAIRTLDEQLDYFDDHRIPY